MSDDDIEHEVQRVLADLDVSYELVRCDPALADTADFCRAYGYSPSDSANTIVVIGKSQPPIFVACVVLADTRLDVNRTVKQRLGVRRASFASAEETSSLTGMTIGGVTVLALPSDLRIWVDERVMSRDRIILGGGSRNSKVVASPDILRRIPNVEIVSSLAIDPRPDRAEHN